MTESSPTATATCAVLCHGLRVMEIKVTRGDGRHNTEVRYLPVLLTERNIAPDLRRAETWMIGGLPTVGHAGERVLVGRLLLGSRATDQPRADNSLPNTTLG